MKRLLLLVTVVYLLVPAIASAHPLGNFTINRFARVEVAGDRLYVRYVVDLAEIPTLQHRRCGSARCASVSTAAWLRSASRRPRSRIRSVQLGSARRASRRSSSG